MRASDDVGKRDRVIFSSLKRMAHDFHFETVGLTAHDLGRLFVQAKTEVDDTYDFSEREGLTLEEFVHVLGRCSLAGLSRLYEISHINMLKGFFVHMATHARKAVPYEKQTMRSAATTSLKGVARGTAVSGKSFPELVAVLKSLVDTMWTNDNQMNYFEASQSRLSDSHPSPSSLFLKTPRPATSGHGTWIDRFLQLAFTDTSTGLKRSTSTKKSLTTTKKALIFKRTDPKPQTIQPRYLDQSSSVTASPDRSPISAQRLHLSQAPPDGRPTAVSTPVISAERRESTRRVLFEGGSKQNKDKTEGRDRSESTNSAPSPIPDIATPSEHPVQSARESGQVPERTMETGVQNKLREKENQRIKAEQKARKKERKAMKKAKKKEKKEKKARKRLKAQLESFGKIHSIGEDHHERGSDRSPAKQQGSSISLLDAAEVDEEMGSFGRDVREEMDSSSSGGEDRDPPELPEGQEMELSGNDDAHIFDDSQLPLIKKLEDEKDGMQFPEDHSMDEIGSLTVSKASAEVESAREVEEEAFTSFISEQADGHERVEDVLGILPQEEVVADDLEEEASTETVEQSPNRHEEQEEASVDEEDEGQGQEAPNEGEAFVGEEAYSGQEEEHYVEEEEHPEEAEETAYYEGEEEETYFEGEDEAYYEGDEQEEAFYEGEDEHYEEEGDYDDENEVDHEEQGKDVYYAEEAEEEEAYYEGEEDEGQHEEEEAFDEGDTDEEDNEAAPEQDEDAASKPQRVVEGGQPEQEDDDRIEMVEQYSNVEMMEEHAQQVEECDPAQVRGTDAEEEGTMGQDDDSLMQSGQSSTFHIRVNMSDSLLHSESSTSSAAGRISIDTSKELVLKAAGDGPLSLASVDEEEDDGIISLEDEDDNMTHPVDDPPAHVSPWRSAASDPVWSPLRSTSNRESQRSTQRKGSEGSHNPQLGSQQASLDSPAAAQDQEAETEDVRGNHQLLHEQLSEFGSGYHEEAALGQAMLHNDMGVEDLHGGSGLSSEDPYGEQGWVRYTGNEDKSGLARPVEAGSSEATDSITRTKSPSPGPRPMSILSTPRKTPQWIRTEKKRAQDESIEHIAMVQSPVSQTVLTPQQMVQTPVVAATAESIRRKREEEESSERDQQVLPFVTAGVASTLLPSAHRALTGS